MLKQLTFTNFKPWSRADLFCRPLTGIFGSNSSGKTSLLQFLLMLKQTKDEPDRARPLKLRGNLVDLGHIKDTIHNHDLSKNVTFDLALELPKEFPVWDTYLSKKPFLRGRNLRVSAEIGVEKGELQARRLCYELDGVSFWLEKKNGKSENGFQLGPLLRRGQEGAFGFVKNRGRSWPLPGPIKSYGFPDQVNAYFQNAGFLSKLVGEYEKQMDNIFYLGPLRISPERDYLWSGTRPTDVGIRGENVVEAILAATKAEETRNIRRNATRKTFQEMIAHCLREMKLAENLRVKEIAAGSDLWQLHVQTPKTSREELIADVGFGVSQVLPVVTLLQYVPEGTTVILEQPEIHLHPCAQSELADVIIQAVTHRKVQVIMESHSELLLLRLQRRIAEHTQDKSISGEDVALYFCNMKNGSSELVDLKLDSDGNIENWPENFMGDAFGETSKAELARLKRRRKV